MSEHFRKAKVVDGYTALKAAQRATPAGAKPPESQEEPGEEKPARKIGTHIARTVLPTRLDLTCYECGFGFHLSGRSPNTYCPRCRVMLNLKDVTVEGSSRESVSTGGVITLAEGAEFREGTLRGGDVVLLGRLAGGRVQADRCLELGPASEFSEEAVQGRDLRVAAGAEVRFRKAAVFRHVEILGRLQAKSLTLSGNLKIRAGGGFKGSVKASGLEVEVGGGLQAGLEILPAGAEA